MAVYYIYPTSDDKAQWTEVPAGAAWSVLNEAVTEADTPDTTNNYVDVTAAGQSNRQFFAVFTPPTGELITLCEAFWYLRSATGQTVDLSLFPPVGGIPLATMNLPAATAFGWQSVSVGTVGPADHPLRLHAASVGTASASSSRLAAEFIKITTTAQPPIPAGMFEPQLKDRVWF